MSTEHPLLEHAAMLTVFHFQRLLERMRPEQAEAVPQMVGELLERLANDPQCSGDIMLDRQMDAEDGGVAATLEDSLQVGCAYYAQSVQAARAGRPVEAFHFIVKAEWCNGFVAGQLHQADPVNQSMAATARRDAMMAMREQGKNDTEIGVRFNISRQRVVLIIGPAKRK